jgi:hypothetical protein
MKPDTFIDRKRELRWLEDGWASGRAQFRILYGRRRVGKSRLLDEFARGKRHVLFQSVEGSTPDQLRDLTTAILACQDDQVLRAAPLGNWDAALAYLANMAAHAPLLVIFDEYQYAAEADPTLGSRLQRWWSRQAVHLPLYVVLCGSYIRFFIRNVLSGPAYGRNTGALRLLPLGHREAAGFFPVWTEEDQIRAYGVVGGVPHYLEQFDPNRDLAWNVQHRILERGAALYQEAELMVREELREPRLYYSILRAISEGRTQVSEIASHVRPQPARSDITPYLMTLQELGLVEYRRPVVGHAVRRGIWSVIDPYLRFWFRFVLPYKTTLDHGANVERFYRETVEPALDQFISKPTFEEVCRSWVRERAANGDLPGADRVGAWWGPVPRPTPENPRAQGEGEVDVIAAQGDHVILAGEAKWTRRSVGFAVLNELRDVLRSVPGVRDDTRLVLFGRSFDERLVASAEAEGVTLVGPSELLRS